MMHVLLTDEVVQEAAVLPEAGTKDSPNDSGSGSRSDGSHGSGHENDPKRSLDYSSGTKSFLRTCLVLVPTNVLRNWQDELKKVRGMAIRAVHRHSSS